MLPASCPPPAAARACVRAFMPPADLNPSNVLLRKDVSSVAGYRVKVADFGLSVLLPTQKTHMSNLRLGTPFYMSPETAFKGHVGSASDVFRWGGTPAGWRSPHAAVQYCWPRGVQPLAPLPASLLMPAYPPVCDTTTHPPTAQSTWWIQ